MQLKKILTLCAILITFNTCRAQIDSIKERLPLKLLYVLKFDDKPPLITEFAYIDPKVITDISSISAVSLRELKSTLNVDDVLIFTIEHGTSLMNLEDILEVYKITWRKKSIKVDDDLVLYPRTLILSRNQIKKVISRNNYIHIILKDYYELKEKYKRAKIIYQ